MKRPAGYGLYIKKVADCMESEANRNLQSRNLTFSQAKILMMLMHRQDHTATLKELEAHFHSAQSTVAGLAARMERKGLLVYVADETDKRVKRVKLTAEGERLSEECCHDITNSDEKLVSALNAEERKQLLSFFERMYESIR